MKRYTQESFSHIMKSPKLISLIVNGKVSLPAVLAKGHIAGHGSVSSSWGGTDWLGTSVRKYAHDVEQAYVKHATKLAVKKDGIQRASFEETKSVVPATQASSQEDSNKSVIDAGTATVNDVVVASAVMENIPTITPIAAISTIENIKAPANDTIYDPLKRDEVLRSITRSISDS